jgi:hypothetical protein
MKNGLKMKLKRKKKEKKQNIADFPFSPDGPAARLASPRRPTSSSLLFPPRR